MKNNKTKILIAAAEITPIAKVGGLGDVIGALPRALKKLNLDARVIIPFYGLIEKNKYQLKLIKNNIKVQTKIAAELIGLWQTTLPGSEVPVYLIEHNFFKGQNIYSSQFSGVSELYPSDLIDIEKFVFFSRAILESIKALNFKPDVIHLNDWHTAAVTLFLKTLYKKDPGLKKIKTLYTIHNLANQGITDPQVIKLNKINPNLASILEDQKDKNINFMVQGILNSSLINTVSPTYAREILTKEYGAGLENILALRNQELYGILNGLDTDFFNPATDKFIKQGYSPKTPEKKMANKLYLQQKLGLPQNKNTALVGLVSRFVWQKGLELITEKFVRAIHEFPLPCQFVFLGTGEKRYETALVKLAKKYPNKFNVQIKFDEKLAHEIYAGSDIFLVPSLFEPCGLTPMIAMRYGSVPLVRSTGGLKDTVNNQVGFTFKKFNSNELGKTLEKALDIFCHQPKIWRQLQLNGMKQDFSWGKSARQYLKLYKKLLNKK